MSTVPSGRLAGGFVELAAATNFSFLRGASHGEEMVLAAVEKGLSGLAVADRNTLAGVVRAHLAAKEAEFPFAVGCRLAPTGENAPEILAWPSDRAAYGRLCRLLTLGNMRGEKGDCRISLQDIAQWGRGTVFAIIADGAHPEAVQAACEHLREATDHPLRLAASCPYGPADHRRLHRTAVLAHHLGLRLLATNQPLFHEPDRRPLHDVLACIREHVTIDTAGRRLAANAERHLKGPEEMARLFTAYPEALAETWRVMESLSFGLDELRYEYPEEPTDPGRSPQETLVRLTLEGAKRRYPEGMPEKVRALVHHELAIISELDYAPYFLTVQDIVRFAREKGILAQGRGSAANSAVCFCLGVTEVDPERGDLLFERFVSAERREPPDIDIDFEHERREEVIQYVYEKYGRDRAGLAATVISYRSRSAAREVGKALGLSEDAVTSLSATIWGWSSTGISPEEARRAGLDPGDRRIAHLVHLTREIAGFPRHLSQHVGGFVITRGRLDEMVPIVKAAMDDRTNVEWDKDDLDALGILKIDVLALGMLTCLRKALDLLTKHYPQDVAALLKTGAFPADTPQSAPATPAAGAGKVRVAACSDICGVPATPLIDEATRPRSPIKLPAHKAPSMTTAITSAEAFVPSAQAGLALRDLHATTGCDPNDTSPPDESRPDGKTPTSGEDPAAIRCETDPPAPEITGRPDLSLIPPEDPAVYDMICRADTLGVFQIESRAQMSMLPRLRPTTFYDLVIEVAIVRPGPIQGDMVHPYLRRRMKREPVSYPSKELESVLGKTLGVPLFQEQAMRIAIVAAGFTPSEADRLRRAMATFRKVGTIGTFQEKMIKGMTARGYDQEFAERCFRQIEGFGEYGFPESHAASFALLVYASCWLKCRYPDVFCAALLNSQPMGFYAPAQIVRDARRHGVLVRPVDVNASDWDNRLEPGPRAADRLHRDHLEMAGAIRARHAVRLGFRQVKGLSEEEVQRLVEVRGAGYDSVRDLWLRTGLKRATIERLADADAFAGLGLTRRDALWAARGLDQGGAAETLPLFVAASTRDPCAEPDAVLPPMPPGEEVIQDYRFLSLSLKAHPAHFVRPELAAERVVASENLAEIASGRRVAVAGLVLVRQRPGSAKGVIFMTLEDETGIANVIVWPKVFEAFRPVVLGARFVKVVGRIQSEDGVIHVVADRLEDRTGLLGRLAETLEGFEALDRADEVKRPTPDARIDPKPRSRLVRLVRERPELAGDLTSTLHERRRRAGVSELSEASPDQPTDSFSPPPGEPADGVAPPAPRATWFSPRAAAVDGSDLAQSILVRRRRGRAARSALPKGRNFH